MKKTYYSEFYPYATEAGVLGTTVPALTEGRVAEIVNDIGSIINDSILTPDEKIRILIPLHDEIEISYDKISGQAIAFNINISQLNNARSAWIAYLNSLSPAWDNINEATTIDREEFRLKVNQYLEHLSIIDANNGAEAARRADVDGGLTDNGVPITRDKVITSEGTSKDTANVGGVPSAFINESLETVRLANIEIDAQLGQLATSLDTAKSDIIAAQTSANNAINSISTVDQNLKAADQIIRDSVVAESTARGQLKTALEAADQAIRDTAATTKTALEAADQTIRNSVTAEGTARGQLKTALEAADAAIRTSVTAEATARGQLKTALEAADATLTAKTNDLDVRLAEAFEALGEGEDGQLGTRIDAIEQRASTLETDKASVVDLNAVKTRVTTAEGTLTSQNTRLTTAETNIAGKASNSDFQTLETEVTTARGSATSLNNRLNTTDTTIAGKASTQSVTDLTTRVTSVEGVNTAQNTRLSTAEVELGKKALATDLTALQGRVTTAETDLTATNTRLNTVETTANSAAKATDLTALTGRVSTAETDITATKTKLSTVETTANNAAKATDLTALTSTVNTKPQTFAQATAPSSTGRITGDLWVNTASNNQLNRWSGSAWVVVHDVRGADALAELAAARNGSTSLNAQLQSMRQTSTDLASGKTNVSDFNALTARVATAEGVNTAQNTRLNTVETDVAGKASAQSVSDLSSSVVGLTTRVGATETATADLAAKKADATRVATLEARASDLMAKTLPSTFENGSEFFTTGDTGNTWTGFTLIDTDKGKAWKLTGSTFRQVRQKGSLPAVVGRTYRATAIVKNTTADTTVRPWVRLVMFNAAGAKTDGPGTYASGGTAWETITSTFKVTNAAHVEIRAEAILNYKGGAPGNTVDVGGTVAMLLIEDITADDLTARVGTTETATANLATNKADASRVTTLENAINTPTTGLTAKVSALQATTTQLGTDKANASDLTALQGRVTTAESDITAAKTRLNTVETTANNAAKASDLTALTTRVTTAEGVNTAQNTRLTTAESDIAGKASAQSVTDLSSSVAVRNRTFRQNAAPTSPAGGYPLIAGDTWIDTTAGQNNAISVWTGTAWTTAVDPRIAQSATGVSDLTAKIGNVSGTVADALNGKASAQSVTDLTTRVASTESVNAAQNTRLSTVETTANNAAKASDLTALTTRVTTAEGVNTAQNTRLNTVETDVAGKASAQSVSDLNTSVLGLTTRVGATETATSNLATQKADATRVTSLEAQAKQTPGANLITKGVWTDTTVGPWLNVNAVADDGPSGLGRKFVMRTTGTDALHGDLQPGSWQNRKFRATGWVKIPTGTATVGIGVIGQNANGASVHSYAGVSAPSDAWTAFDLVLTAPANMVTGRPFVRSNSPFGVLWTDLRMEDITEAQAVDTKLTSVTARVGTVETATASLQTGKADASRVTTLEAKTATLEKSDLIDKGLIVPSADAWSNYPSSPETSPNMTYPVTTVDGKASIILGDNQHVYWKKAVRVEPDHVYEIRVEAEPSTANNATIGLGFWQRDSKFVAFGTPEYQLASKTVTERAFYVHRFTPRPGTYWIKPAVKGNSVNSYSPRIFSLECIDVTATVAAETNTALTARVTTTETATTNLQTQKADASRVTTLENAINAPSTGLDAKVSALQATTTQLGADKANASDLTALQGRMTTAENDLTATNTRLNTVETTANSAAKASDLTALTTRVSNAEGVNTAQNTRLTTAESNIAGKASAQSVTDLSSSVAVRNRTFRQSAAPTSPAGGYPLIAGDTWINTTTGQNNALSIWTGSAWTTAVDPRIGTSAQGVTDLTAKIGTVSGTVADALAGKAGASDLTALTGRVTTAEGSLTAQNTRLNTVETGLNGKASAQSVTDLTSTVETKPQTFAQATAPSSTGRITGDLWANTSANNQLNRWSGTAWVAVHDVRGADALAELTAARNGSANLNAQLSTMRQTSTDLASGKANVSDFNTLRTEVTTARGSATSLNNRLNTAESNIAGKASAQSVTDLNSTVGGLTGRMTTVENATANLAANKADASRVTNLEARAGASVNEWANGDLSQGTYGFRPGWNAISGVVDIGHHQDFLFVHKTGGGKQEDGFTTMGSILMCGGQFPAHTNSWNHPGNWRVSSGERIGIAFDAQDEGSTWGLPAARWWVTARLFAMDGSLIGDISGFSSDYGNGSWHRRGAVFTVPQSGYLTIEAYLQVQGPPSAQISLLAKNFTFSRLAPGATALPIFSAPSDGMMNARVTATETATADLYGKTRARWAIGTSVNGADAFIQAEAEVTPGQPATSSVGIGARAISLYNPAGEDWRLAMRVEGGNAVFTGGLQAGAFIKLGNGQGWPVALRPVDFNASDGEVVNFGTDLGNLPSLAFAMNGLAPLNTGETYDVRAENLTATGFTMRAKINIPATPSAQQADGPGSIEVFGPGNSGRTVGLGSKPSAVDGVYQITASGTQMHRIYSNGGNVPVFDPENNSVETTTLSIWAYTTSWQQITTVYATSMVDSFGYPQGRHDVNAGWNISESIQMPSDVIAINVTRVGSSNNLAGSVNGLNQIKWTAQGAGSGVRSATPNGQKTRITVRPQ